MRAPFSLFCLFPLSLGTCFPRASRRSRNPGGNGACSGAAGERRPRTGGPGGQERRRSEERSALLSIARELRGDGEEGAGQRPGRQRGSGLRAQGRREAQRTLSEELSGYSRSKGGFAFRFGR